MKIFCIRLLPLVVLCGWEICYGQGTFVQITFDGPPLIAPGTARLVQSYGEAGTWFTAIPGYDGFGRQGSSPAAWWPNNGTAYVVASLGDSLMFGRDDGSLFGLASVDLAEWSTSYPEPVTVPFVGYRPDGGMVIVAFTTDGVMDGTGPLADFQTFYFGPEFSGLSEVRIPAYGWSLDNLVLSIPEPSGFSLLLVGLVVARVRMFKPVVSKRARR